MLEVHGALSALSSAMEICVVALHMRATQTFISAVISENFPACSNNALLSA